MTNDHPDKNNQNVTRKRKIFISAGEASGDIIAADIISEILKQNPQDEVYGVTGPAMRKARAKSVMDISDIAVMGYVEVLTAIPKIYLRIRKIAKFLKEYKPDIILTVDSRGFNFRVVKKVRDFLKTHHNTKFIHCVSPTIWAYRYKRIYAIKELYDLQLVLFPFEVKYYQQEGIPVEFVGHPLTSRTYPAPKPSSLIPLPDSSEAQGFKLANASEENNPKTLKLAIFIGSRRQEIEAMGDIFLEAALLVSQKLGCKLELFLPTLESVHDLVEKKVHTFKQRQQLGDSTVISKVVISTTPTDKDLFLPECDLILSKSGTSSIELLFYRKPIVVAHKINSITSFFISRLLKVKYVSIANILLDKEVIPELIQDKCNSNDIAFKICQLLAKEQTSIIKEYDQAIAMLQPNYLESQHHSDEKSPPKRNGSNQSSSNKKAPTFAEKVNAALSKL